MRGTQHLRSSTPLVFYSLGTTQRRPFSSAPSCGLSIIKTTLTERPQIKQSLMWLATKSAQAPRLAPRPSLPTYANSMPETFKHFGRSVCTFPVHFWLSREVCKADKVYSGSVSAFALLPMLWQVIFLSSNTVEEAHENKEALMQARTLLRFQSRSFEPLKLGLLRIDSIWWRGIQETVELSHVVDQSLR
jgi:hypothetical protein